MEYLHKEFPPIDEEKFKKIQRESPTHKKEDILVPKNKR